MTTIILIQYITRKNEENMTIKTEPTVAHGSHVALHAEINKRAQKTSKNDPGNSFLAMPMAIGNRPKKNFRPKNHDPARWVAIYQMISVFPAFSCTS
jgi:hypothetical protein